MLQDKVDLNHLRFPPFLDRTSGTGPYMLRRTFALSTIHNGVKTFLNSPLNSDTILVQKDVLQSHENLENVL